MAGISVMKYVSSSTQRYEILVIIRMYKSLTKYTRLQISVDIYCVFTRFFSVISACALVLRQSQNISCKCCPAQFLLLLFSEGPPAQLLLKAKLTYRNEKTTDSSKGSLSNVWIG
jgi:hypothetical protein